MAHEAMGSQPAGRSARRPPARRDAQHARACCGSSIACLACTRTQTTCDWLAARCPFAPFHSATFRASHPARAPCHNCPFVVFALRIAPSAAQPWQQPPRRAGAGVETPRRRRQADKNPPRAASRLALRPASTDARHAAPRAWVARPPATPRAGAHCGSRPHQPGGKVGDGGGGGGAGLPLRPQGTPDLPRAPGGGQAADPLRPRGAAAHRRNLRDTLERSPGPLLAQDYEHHHDAVYGDGLDHADKYEDL